MHIIKRMLHLLVFTCLLLQTHTSLSLNFFLQGPIALSLHSVIHNGIFDSEEKIDITCIELCTGIGTFKAPIIVITTKRFEFTGTINCSTQCTITTAAPFNHSIFQQEGSGTFIFIVDPTLQDQ